MVANQLKMAKTVSLHPLGRTGVALYSTGAVVVRWQQDKNVKEAGEETEGKYQWLIWMGIIVITKDVSMSQKFISRP